jgi:hypothetical protein
MTDIIQIKDSGILPDDILDKLKEIDEDLEAGFTRRQRFRPRFLMETAVLNDMKFPTPDAKYWQCNVERDTHFRNLIMTSFDYREKQADIEILEEEFTGLSGPHRTKKLVQIEREKALLIYMQKEARERVREVLNWTEIMQNLKPLLKYDPDDVEAHMPEAYAIRYGREMEAMKIAGACNAHDMSGAMNIISLSKSIEAHPQVRELIDELPTDIAGLAMVAEGKDPKRQELGKGEADVVQS